MVSILVTTLSISTRIIIENAIGSRDARLPVRNIDITIRKRGTTTVSSHSNTFVLSISGASHIILTFSNTNIIPVRRLIRLGNLRDRISVNIILLRVSKHTSLSSSVVLAVSRDSLRDSNASRDVDNLLSSRNSIFSSRTNCAFDPVQFHVQNLRNRCGSACVGNVPVGSARHNCFSCDSINKLGSVLHAGRAIGSARSTAFAFNGVKNSRGVGTHTSTVHGKFGIDRITSGHACISHAVTACTANLVRGN